MYIRGIFITSVLVLDLFLSAQSQSRQYPKISYFDKDHNSVNSSENAAFVQQINQEKGQLTIAEFYYPSKKIRMFGYLISENPLKYQGEINWFYENDSLEHTAQYHLGDKTGTEIFYYENGLKKEELIHAGKAHKTIQIWQEDGTPLLVNGTGESTEINIKRSVEIYSAYVDSMLVEQFEIRKIKGDTIYYHMDELAEYLGGMPAFYKQIGNVMEYPKSARRYGIQGRVYVSFIVNKKGEMEEIEVVKGIDKECDLEAERAVQTLSKGWKPATKNGQFVKSRMVLPIIFKLGK